MSWKRPADVTLGQVWRRFRGRPRDGRPAQTYEIRDIDEEDMQRCLEFTKENFLRDEPLCQVFDILSDHVSVATILRNWSGHLDAGVSVACYEVTAGELVAVSLCNVCSLNDEPFVRGQEGESWGKLLATLVTAESSVDIFKHYDVDKYFSTNVLVVSPDHRGMNISMEMFRATEDLARTLGIKAAATVVTALESQAITKKCGYELLSEMPYEKMREQGIEIVGCSTPSAQVRGIYLG